VEVWYTTPRTIRGLMEAGEDLPGRYDHSHLRHIATVGAPLVPDLFYWVRKNLGRSAHDTWWMTETGMICIANFPAMDIKPGSMGKPVPGVKTAILDEAGHPLPPLSLGELAVKTPWPCMMTDMWEDRMRYRDYFRENGWMLTGDMAIEDEEGYIYHQGRNDDLIKSGGDKVIGPYEIENVLTGHPAVAEAAVIAMGREPGEGVSYLKAFIVLHPGPTPSVRLSMEIKAFVKANLSSDVVVQDIAFVDDLPKTRSGKLLRRILRAKELGLPG
jgi:acetyl-CoA synthetase